LNDFHLLSLLFHFYYCILRTTIPHVYPMGISASMALLGENSNLKTQVLGRWLMFCTRQDRISLESLHCHVSSVATRLWLYLNLLCTECI
jgi:hypothetical protein